MASNDYELNQIIKKYGRNSNPYRMGIENNKLGNNVGFKSKN